MEQIPQAMLAAQYRLDRIASVALTAGRLLMESGARNKVIHQGATMIAKAFGVEDLGIRCGYASIEVTLTAGVTSVTRMVTVGRHGVNHRLDQAVRNIASRVASGELSLDDCEIEIRSLAKRTPRHPAWLVAVAVGLACASFGRLLGVDWPAFLPVVVGGGVGQYVRHLLAARAINVFVATAAVAFVAASLGGIGAQLAGSQTINLAMMASILLLVPGVPATNAQTDIMEGYPTVGSARAVWVIMIMIFAATGVWLAEALLGVHS